MQLNGQQGLRSGEGEGQCRGGAAGQQGLPAGAGEGDGGGELVG